MRPKGNFGLVAAFPGLLFPDMRQVVVAGNRVPMTIGRGKSSLPQQEAFTSTRQHQPRRVVLAPPQDAASEEPY